MDMSHTKSMLAKRFFHIPEDCRVTACGLFLQLLLLHPKIDEQIGHFNPKEKSLYCRFHHLFDGYASTLKLIEAGAAYYDSIKNSACERIQRSVLDEDWDLETEVTHDVPIRAGVPMTSDEIEEHLNERMPLALAGWRWGQLVQAVGSEEFYLCFHIMLRKGVEIEGIDFLKAVFGENDEEFEHLKEACVRNGWLREVCLGLRGVAASVKMLEVSDDRKFQEEVASRIQEQVGKVFGAITPADFDRAAGPIIRANQPELRMNMAKGL